jgi:hypothetical protein
MGNATTFALIVIKSDRSAISPRKLTLHSFTMPLINLVQTAIQNRCLPPEQEARIASELEHRMMDDIDEIELAALSLLEALIANGTIDCSRKRF